MTEQKENWETRLANALDNLRAMPRFLIGSYIYLVFLVTEWFMALPDPTNQQATFVTVVYGLSGAWFSLYVNTKRDGRT